MIIHMVFGPVFWLVVYLRLYLGSVVSLWNVCCFVLLFTWLCGVRLRCLDVLIHRTYLILSFFQFSVLWLLHFILSLFPCNMLLLLHLLLFFLSFSLLWILLLSCLGLRCIKFSVWLFYQYWKRIRFMNFRDMLHTTRKLQPRIQNISDSKHKGNLFRT